MTDAATAAPSRPRTARRARASRPAARGDPRAASTRPAPASARRISPTGTAPAGVPCARRCACSRPRGWSRWSPTPAPGSRGSAMAECDEMYQIRERIEPLLLRYNIPLLTPADIDELDRLAGAMERLGRRRGVPRPRPRVPPRRATPSARRPRARRHRAAALEPHAALPPRVHRLFRSEGDRSVHHEHHLLVSAIRRDDLEKRSACSPGHIRRTRLELARHPDVFE